MGDANHRRWYSLLRRSQHPHHHLSRSATRSRQRVLLPSYLLSIGLDLLLETKWIYSWLGPLLEYFSELEVKSWAYNHEIGWTRFCDTKRYLTSFFDCWKSFLPFDLFGNWAAWSVLPGVCWLLVLAFSCGPQTERGVRGADCVRALVPLEAVAVSLPVPEQRAAIAHQDHAEPADAVRGLAPPDHAPARLRAAPPALRHLPRRGGPRLWRRGQVRPISFLILSTPRYPKMVSKNKFLLQSLHWFLRLKLFSNS